MDITLLKGVVHDTGVSFDEICNKMIAANIKTNVQCENEKKNFLADFVGDVCGGNFKRRLSLKKKNP